MRNQSARETNSSTIVFHTRPYITILDALVLFVVLGSEEFPPISPLQLLLLCSNLPQILHCLEMPALLFGSLGSLALFFLGLLGGLLLMEGQTGVTPLGLYIFCPLIGVMIDS